MYISRHAHVWKFERCAYSQYPFLIAVNCVITIMNIKKLVYVYLTLRCVQSCLVYNSFIIAACLFSSSGGCAKFGFRHS